MFQRLALNALVIIELCPDDFVRLIFDAPDEESVLLATHRGGVRHAGDVFTQLVFVEPVDLKLEPVLFVAMGGKIFYDLGQFIFVHLKSPSCSAKLEPQIISS